MAIDRALHKRKSHLRVFAANRGWQPTATTPGLPCRPRPSSPTAAGQTAGATAAPPPASPSAPPTVPDVASRSQNNEGDDVVDDGGQFETIDIMAGLRSQLDPEVMRQAAFGVSFVYVSTTPKGRGCSAPKVLGVHGHCMLTPWPSCKYCYLESPPSTATHPACPPVIPACGAVT